MMMMLVTMMRLMTTMSFPMFFVANGVDDDYTNNNDYNGDVVDDINNDGDAYFHR